MAMAVPIGVFRIGRTHVDREEVARWMKFIGADQFEVPDDGAVSNPALLIALAGKRCYKSFQPGLNPNVTKIRADYAEYFDNILSSGHGSVLEHSVFTFAFENVSRVFTAEMNRHRAGWAISEGSLRFIRFGDGIPYWEPDSIKGPDCLSGRVKVEVERAAANLGAEMLPDGLSLEGKKHATRILFRQAFRDQARVYRLLERVWADELAPSSKFKGKKEITSLMRRIVGMGVATGGVWSGNVRGLRHVLTMRCSPQAEEEILHVFTRVAKRMRDDEPLLFGDFRQDDAGFWVPKYVKV